MSLTTEQLLQPRYKVISDYPLSDFEINEILYADKYGAFWVCEDGGKWRLYPEKYPAIFKAIYWYEDRKVEDMPMFLKMNKFPTYVIKPIYHDEGEVGLFYLDNDGADQFLTNDFSPATLKEYNDYQSKQKA